MGRGVSTTGLMVMTALAAGGAVAAYAAGSRVGTPPIARYEMKAGTVSGMGAMGGPGGGKRPGAGAAMSMMFGGGRNSAQHQLELELGSSLAPTGGAPKADHFIPAGMKLGASLALKTPQHTSGTPGEPGEFQRPKMRMLIFWGCGEHAPKGQPVVIDFSKLSANAIPPGLFSTTVPADNWVTEANSRTYGRWPSDDGKYVKPDSMLPGPQRVVSNYAPEMDFTLTHDFMEALRASSAEQASGSTLLSWNQVPDATGYYAWVMGGKGNGQQMEDVVWWTSSASREFGGGLTDWLSPATVARLVANHTVLPPQTTSCTVPAEVKQAAPNFMYGMIYAYGPEESFVYPPRPRDPKVAWHPQWEARIRHRSMTGMMMGVPGMEGMGGMAQSGDEGTQEPKCKPKKKKRGLGGLGGMLGSVISGQLPSDSGCQ